MAGFVAMISVFLVVSVEMFFASKGARHVHGVEYANLLGGEEPEYPVGDSGYHTLNRRDATNDTSAEEMDERTVSATISNSAALPEEGSAGISIQQTQADGSRSSKEGNDNELEELGPYTNGDLYEDESRQRRSLSQSPELSSEPPIQVHKRQVSDMTFMNPQRQLLQCLLLEAGILFHSIFIGMAVSVATGTSFVVLLVAISFHQTFEGFALGSRIASLIPDLFSPASLRPWLMSLAYGATTPIGQAIGLGIHNLYDPTSAAGLLMVGITNAISSGLLLFAGLVELLAEDFLSESSYQMLRGRRRIEACIAVACGAVLMALVGAFA